ncbi:MAG: ATP-binding protein [Fibromonadales bacterium]|nr:ATP-binding protein [Fibromonadales bacterium]
MKAIRASVGGLSERIFRIIRRYSQVVFVFLAFTIMVVLSCIFMINMEFQHLRKEAKTTLSYAQTNIVSSLQKSEQVLDNIAKTVRVMTMADENPKIIKKCIKDVFDGEYYAISDTNSRIIADRLRYEKTQGAAIITYARRILDNSGKQLGIVYLDVNLSNVFKKYVIDMKITDGGYGMLLNKELKIVAHPFRDFLGASLQDSNMPLSIFEEELMKGREVFEREIVNYEGKKVLVFFKRLENGWFLGAVTPEVQYYQSVIRIAQILCVIAFALASLLGITLVRIIKMRDHAETKAKNANKAKSIFLARMSHEIRTPMNAIMGVTEIELQRDAMEPHSREAFTMIYNSSNLLLGIINNILDLSKIEAGKMEIVSVKYELANLISDVAQLNMMRNSKKIEFEVYVDEHLPMQLFGDEIRIKQILNNLLSNAFKYTNNGRISFSISYEDGPDSEATIVFGVSDTGDGMTEEQAKCLFAPYSRFNLESNRYIQGSGLGMNITQHLLQMMNGRISVESELGKGSTFVVHLPQKKIGFARIGKDMAKDLTQLRLPETVRIKSAQFAYESMTYGKVLIVDDVESNLYVARGLMAPYGLSIDACTGGFKAIEKIRDGNVYDAIFMDHMMPEIDGIETTRRIREMGYTRPIVALTADVLVGQAKRFLENGFDDFVSKPIDVRQLNHVLNKFVRKNTFCVSAKTEIKPELLLMSIRDVKGILPILKFTLENIEDISESSLHLFAIKVHALKSAFANVGETTLSQMSYELELAGKAQDKNAIKQKTPGLIDSVKAFVAKNVVEMEQNPADEDEDSTYLREQLKIISDSCEYYDIKAINAAMANLKKKSWSKATEEILNEISLCLLSSDFEEAAVKAKFQKTTPTPLSCVSK